METINISKVALQHGMFLKLSYTEPLPGNDERKHSSVSCSAPVHEDLAKAFKDFTPHLALICEQISNEEFIDMIPDEYDPTQSTIVELGEMVPAIKASKAKKGKGKGLAGVLNEASSFKMTSIGPDGQEHDISSILGSAATAKDEPKLIDKFALSDVEFKFHSGIESIKLTGQMQLSTLEWIGMGPTPWIKINGLYPHISDLFQLGELLKYEVQEYIINHKYAPPVDPELPFGESDRESFGDGAGLTEKQLREEGEEMEY